MKKKAKYMLTGIIVLIIIGAIIMNALQPLAVEVIVIKPTHAQDYFTERGYVRDNKLIAVYSVVEGKVIDVCVQEGQMISAGENIGIVDSSNFLHEIEKIRLNNRTIFAQIDNLDTEEDKTRDSLRSDKNKLQGELNSILAQEQMAQISKRDKQQIKSENIRLQNLLIEQSNRGVQNAELELAKASFLHDIGEISNLELEAAMQTLEDSRTALAVNEQQLEIIISETIADQSDYYKAQKSLIQSQIDSIDTALKASYSEHLRQYYQAQIESGDLEIDSLELMVSNCTIKSPVSGKIERLNIGSANVLDAVTPAAEIRIDSEKLVEVFVSTVNIDDIQIGDRVELSFTRQNGDAVYIGTVQDIGNRAEAVLSVLGVEERRVKVLIKPDTISENFNGGFDVDVRFITYSSDNRIVIPATAIFEKNGQSMLYLVQNGNAIATSIELGARIRTEIVVKSGIDFGDTIIRDVRQDGLRNGAKVKY